MLYFGISAIIVGLILAFRGPIAVSCLPWKSLTILCTSHCGGLCFLYDCYYFRGTLAADAWGSYWQWILKKHGPLIVWLNYAAWLHMRFMKALRGTFSAYWALVGLLITSFAFLGVNMFLSGLPPTVSFNKIAKRGLRPFYFDVIFAC